MLIRICYRPRIARHRVRASPAIAYSPGNNARLHIFVYSA